MIFTRHFALLTLVLLMSSCELLQTRNPSMADDPYLNTWHAKGKFSYQSNQTSESGNFDWQQEYGAYEIRLYGPFGLGSIRLSGNNQFVQLRNGNETVSSSKPQTLLREATGLEIPVSSLTKWMTGQPASRTANNITYNSNGAIQGFSENGWKVSYTDYKAISVSNQSGQNMAPQENVFLPARVVLEQQDIKIQLITKSWDF